jgi:hypothetical protein
MSAPEFNWVPPVWDTTKPDLKKDPNNQNSPAPAPTFTSPTPLDGNAVKLGQRLKDLDKKFPGKIGHVKGNRAVEKDPNSEFGNDLKQVPHPDSDYSHIDPGVYDQTEVAQFLAAITALGALEGLAAKDGEVHEAFGIALPALRKIEPQFDLSQPGAPLPKPKGMQRLKRVFENTLCNVTALFGEMNAALLDNKRDDYNNARDFYITLLKDLDNREPAVVTPGEAGYGKNLQWLYVKPLIHDGIIKGAKLQAKWNPHMSSSGIPIPHA